MTNLLLHDKQTVIGLRKIAWASVFCFSLDFFFIKHQNSMPMSPSLYVSISLCFQVSMFLGLYVSMSPPPCLHVPEFGKRKTEITANGNFCFFAANGNGKQKFVLDNCFFSKRASLCLFENSFKIPFALLHPYRLQST
jgi:hypothetical protein